jgi:hypothetical protein
MKPEDMRFRLLQLVGDFQKTASDNNGIVSGETLEMTRTLVEAAKKEVPDDAFAQSVRIPDTAKFSDLIPLVRQVALALPEYGPMVG